MKILLDNPGKTPRFILSEKEEEFSLKDDEVLIQTAYSGLNFADVMMTMDLYPEAPKAPFCPGYEISGHVIAVGKSVHDLSPGDSVMAGTRFGGYAARCLLPRWQVLKVPKHLNLKEAAGLMVSYLTADLCLYELCRLRTEDSIMIDCASGALGAILIEICKKRGVESIVGLTSSDEKISVIEKRGVTGMTLKDWEQSNKKVDIIINSRGGRTFKKNRERLNPLGRMVGVGAGHMTNKGKKSFIKIVSEFLSFGFIHPISLMNENQSVGGLNVLRLFDHQKKIEDSLLRLNDLELYPKIDRIFNKDNVSEAIEYLATGKSQGKVLLKWDGP